MNNEEKKLQKTNINWLACIYAVHHLKPYKMGTFKKWDLASFIKKEEKFEKTGQELLIFEEN